MINTGLSSIPMYTKGFYWLNERFDSDTGRLFWEGVGNKKKYHMVKWGALAKPKEFAV